MKTLVVKKSMEVLLGYACISHLSPELKTHNTSTLTYVSKLPKKEKAEYVKAKAHQNLKNLPLLLEENYKRNIFAYRIVDELIPFNDMGWYDIEEEHKEELEKIGSVANKYNMYLSYHPSQFYVLNSKTPKTVENTIKGMDTFAKILSLMKLKNTPVLLLHVGGIKAFKDYEEACDEFCKNYHRLSPITQSYMAVENDQSSHSVDSCMYIHRKIGIPVVLDHAHYDYLPTKGVSLAQALKLAMCTWGDRCPKVHLCSQDPSKKMHAHAEYCTYADYKRVYDGLYQSGVKKVIMMLEVKNKDNALMKLRDDIAKHEK